MAFGWLGTFRQGSWQAFRSFTLQERRDAAKRISVILAELERIGQVTVLYVETEDLDGNKTVTEERAGIMVSSGSSLERLMQVYVALGGNPFDISMFLVPDATVYSPLTGQEEQTQPYSGVIAPKGAEPTGGGGVYKGGFLAWNKYTPARVGGRRVLNNSRPEAIVDLSRRWISQEIKTKRNNIEAKIIKLCDLREQLLHEIDLITGAVGGVVAGVPEQDPARFDPKLRVGELTQSIDSVFHEMDEDGTPDFATHNAEALASYPSLMDDILPDENNTAV